MTKQGEWLKQARENAGLKNKDVCKALGISSGRLSMIESGRNYANGQLADLCALYGVDPADAPIARRRRRKKVEEQPQSNDRDVYIRIAQLAAGIGDTDMAMDALAKVEVAS